MSKGFLLAVDVKHPQNMDSQLNLDYRFAVNTPQDLQHVQLFSELMENSPNPVKVGCATDGMPFSARFKMAEYKDIGLIEFRLDPNAGSHSHLTFERARSHIARNQSYAFNLVVGLDGEIITNTFNRALTFRSGDISVMTSDSPVNAIMQNRAGICNLALPASWDRIGDTRLEKAFGTLYSGSEQRNNQGLLRHIKQLLNRPDELSRPDAPEKLYDMIALMLNPRATSQHRAGLLAMIQNHVDSHFADNELCPAKVALSFNISVRYLHQLFVAEEMTFTEYLTRQRLQHAHQLLSDPLSRQRSILGIAYDCGFSDINHFGRRFKTHFGHTPGEYRRAQHHAQ